MLISKHTNFYKTRVVKQVPTWINSSRHAMEPAATDDSNGVILSSVSAFGCKAIK